MTEGGDGFLAHLAQPDHWTFLAAFALVVANVRLRSRRASAAAAALLAVALGYDAYEFYADAE
jgi:hypothetical protein